MAFAAPPYSINEGFCARTLISTYRDGDTGDGIRLKGGVIMIIETERLILREFTVDDWKQVHVYASDADLVQFMAWGPNSEDATKDYIDRMIISQKQNPREIYESAITLKDNGSLIGGCGLHVEEHSQAALGYCLNRQFWGSGFATEAAYALCKFGFSEIKLHRIFATCRPVNIG